jgi:starch synthase
VPLLGVVSRLANQKGIDLVLALVDALVSMPAQLVVLGTGDRAIEQALLAASVQYPGCVAFSARHDETMAHLIEAGADIFLMPSRFEPCGLNQMYSLRYGTVPLVRRVGGLADTVVDYAPGRAGATGFVFEEYTPEALLATFRRALALFANSGEWRVLQAAGMAADHSWDRSAREYVKIYERLITKGDANGSRKRADFYGR